MNFRIYRRYGGRNDNEGVHVPSRASMYIVAYGLGMKFANLGFNTSSSQEEVWPRGIYVRYPMVPCAPQITRGWYRDEVGKYEADGNSGHPHTQTRARQGYEEGEGFWILWTHSGTPFCCSIDLFGRFAFL